MRAQPGRPLHTLAATFHSSRDQHSILLAKRNRAWIDAWRFTRLRAGATLTASLLLRACQQ
jgi:hypothetical protein